jgi:hypothetical protein
MGAKRNRRQLRAAHETGEPVRLARSLSGAQRLGGFVMAVADDWVLLHRLRDVQLDGWSAVRLDTVASVQRQGIDALALRALRIRKQEPSAIDVDLSSVRTVLHSMAAALPLITLNREVLHPDECVISRPLRLTGKKIHLRDITTEATWVDVPYALRLADITRVDAGADYETALYQLGGEPPKLKKIPPSVDAS